jgi:hypothetical protein
MLDWPLDVSPRYFVFRLGCDPREGTGDHRRHLCLPSHALPNPQKLPNLGNSSQMHGRSATVTRNDDGRPWLATRQERWTHGVVNHAGFA